MRPKTAKGTYFRGCGVFRLRDIFVLSVVVHAVVRVCRIGTPTVQRDGNLEHDRARIDRRDQHDRRRYETDVRVAAEDRVRRLDRSYRLLAA